MKGELKTMKFTVMEELPRKREYNPLGKYLEEFMRMNVKVARVDFDAHEYASAKVCQTTLYTSIKRRALPIKTSVRNNEVYLIRTDM